LALASMTKKLKWDGDNSRLKTSGKRLQEPMVMDQIHWGEKEQEKELKPDTTMLVLCLSQLEIPAA